MRSTFSDYCATQDARNDIKLKIVEHCLTLCDKLAQNFAQRHPKSSMKFELRILLVASITRSGRFKIRLHDPATLSLIRRLVKSTNQHLTRHLLRLCAIIFWRLHPVKSVSPVLIGQVVIFTFAEL